MSNERQFQIVIDAEYNIYKYILYHVLYRISNQLMVLA
jgi:hypothetical protein